MTISERNFRQVDKTKYLRAPACHLGVLICAPYRRPFPSHLSGASVSLKVKEMGKGAEVMSGVYEMNPSGDSSVSEGKAQAAATGSAVPRG